MTIFFIFLPFPFDPIPPISTFVFCSSFVHSPEGRLMVGSLADMSSFSLMSIMSWAFPSSSLKVCCCLARIVCLCFLELPLNQEPAFVKMDTSLFMPSFNLTVLQSNKIVVKLLDGISSNCLIKHTLPSQ